MTKSLSNLKSFKNLLKFYENVFIFSLILLYKTYIVSLISYFIFAIFIYNFEAKKKKVIHKVNYKAIETVFSSAFLQGILTVKLQLLLHRKLLALFQCEASAQAVQLKPQPPVITPRAAHVAARSRAGSSAWPELRPQFAVRSPQSAVRQSASPQSPVSNIKWPSCTSCKLP